MPASAPTILVAEPVPETRELLIRLAGRQGWNAVGWPGIGPGDVDALLYEPLSRIGREAREHVRRHHPGAALVAITVSPAEATGHGADHLIAQPFAPGDVMGLLGTLLARRPRPAAA